MEEILFLKSMKFDRVSPSDEAALALAKAWFAELSGSAESRMSQASARRWLTALIRARMERAPASRNLEQVVQDAKRRAEEEAGGDLGLETLLLNVTEARAGMHSETWRRTLEHLSAGAARVPRAD